jgi:hypothetical protein
MVEKECYEETHERNTKGICYKQGDCTFFVHREFEKGGNTILTQVVSLLLDIMEQRENKKPKL